MSNPTVAMTKGGDVVYVPAELRASLERDGFTVVEEPKSVQHKKENN